MKHGFLLVDKPTDMTSHDVVAIARRALHEKNIGHLGTLDPAATGLMILAVGKKALKVIELFEKATKEYIASITFGATSSTYDREGIITKTEQIPGFIEPSTVDIERVIRDFFLGDVNQVPPAHSAIHIAGKRAYEFARQGELVTMPTRQVHISACTLLDYSFPELRLNVACSSGTYIRSLAHDLGVKMFCGAYLSGLRRTKVDAWSVDFAIPPESITWSFIIPLKEVLASYKSITLSDAEWQKISVGQSIARTVTPNTIAWHNDLPVAILIPDPKNTELVRARKVL